MQKLELPWQDPLILAQKIANNQNEQDWALLYSGLSDENEDSISYIGLVPQEKIITDSFKKAENIIKNSQNKWFGYFSYELGQKFEKLPQNQASFIDLPSIYLINFAITLKFDHKKQILEANFNKKADLKHILRQKEPKNDQISPKIAKISSNFSDKSYLQAISDIKKMIANGDFYQTNLTRKFYGEFAEKPDIKQNFQIFHELTQLSPANYSSFLQFGDACIISSSPELFLEAKNNKIISRPIKGTAPRSQNVQEDLKNKSYLENSEKERAENLMIVDLVRNDLSRICKAGSIKVNNLFKINSYKKIHHMSSEIHGQIADKFCAIDAIKTCFPPGSMTGAPKIKAMIVAAQKEQINRGIYSGTIGIFSKDEINSSVVIRTLITRGKKFEFQVGGAITFDSKPKLELAETFNKAQGLTASLKIADLSNLQKN